MELSNHANEAQAALWNGHAGRAWVEAQDLLDHMFRPFENLLVEAVAANRPGRVLDVGCGTGSTTLAIANRLGAQAHCVGADISEPMIDLARARAVRAGSSTTFVRADAQVHAFDPPSFDTMVSRFGVMFFDDPVRAFANLRRAARDGAALKLQVWRSGQENPFMTTAERAAMPLLPQLPTRPANGPGQFAFADRDHVTGILKQGGWGQIDIQPIDVVCTFPECELVRYFSWLGPVGQFLQQADEPTRDQIIEVVRAAFDPYVQSGEVRYTAACWSISAVAC